MKLFLLNSVHKSPVVCNANKFKTFDTKKLTKHIKQIEQRKIENFKQSVSFFKDMAQQDVKFFQSIHDAVVKEFEESNITTTIVPFASSNDTNAGEPKKDIDEIFDN